jgi:RNA polymerase-associated protein RTF1
MPLQPVSREVSELIKGRKGNETKSKRELLFDSSSEEEENSTEYVKEVDLEKMTEVEREAYIFEREQAKQAKKEREDLERRIKRMEKQEIEAFSQTKHSAFEHKLKKMEQLRDSKRKRREYEDSDYSEEEVHSSPRKGADQTEKKVELAAILGAQLKRDVIEKSIYRPSFNDVAHGCFVRVNLGRGRSDEPVYRMCQISKLLTGTKSYMIGKTSTNLKGLLAIGDSNRECNLDIVSNSAITKDEFEFWLSNCEKSKFKPLSCRFLTKKEQELQKFIKEPVGEDEMKAIIERKRASGNVTLNIAAEKAKILIELEEAKSLGNQSKVSVLESRLKEISSNDKGDIPSTSLFNQQRKLFTGSDSAASNSTGEHDPFMRRKCKPLDIHFAVDGAKESIKLTASSAQDKIKTTAGIDDTARKEAKSCSSSIANLVETHKNIEFDLDI